MALMTTFPTPHTHACTVGTFSFPFLISLYVFVQYSERYESGPFNTGAGGTSADYAWMLALGGMMLCVAGFLTGSPFMGQALSYYITYVWSRKNPDENTSIFGFQVKAFYLPFALVAVGPIEMPVRVLPQSLSSKPRSVCVCVRLRSSTC